MARDFEVRSRFSFKDDFSGGFSLMMRKAEGSLSSAETRFGRFGKFMAASEKDFKKVAKSGALIGAGIVAPLAYATKQAMDFESAMADVAKVAGVQVGSDEFHRLGDSAKDLAIQLGIGAEESAELMAGISQGGVALKDLDEVSNIAGKVGVAFGISAGEAGEFFIKTRNALGGTVESTSLLMDAINHLGNTTSAQSPEILKFMAAGGAGISRATGASAESVSAMGAQFISLGKSAEESATIMRRFMRDTLQNKALRKIFEDAGGGAEGMLAVLEKGMSKSGAAQTEFFKQFGAYGVDIQLAASEMGSMRNMIDEATNAQTTLGSVTDEFANRTSTSQFKMQQNLTRLKILVIEIGNVLIPMLNKVMAKVTPILDRMVSWVRENKEMVKTGIKVALVIAGIAFAVSGFATIMLGLSKVIKAVQVAQILWNIAMTANPIGIIIMGVAALIGLIYKLVTSVTGWGEQWNNVVSYVSDRWELFKLAFTLVGQGISHAFLSMVDGIVLAWKWGMNAIGMLSDKEYNNDIKRIKDAQKAREEGIKETVLRGAELAKNMTELEWKLGWADSESTVDVNDSTLDVQTESPVSSSSYSNVNLNINNNGERSSQDITGGDFNMEIMPQVPSM